MRRLSSTICYQASAVALLLLAAAVVSVRPVTSAELLPTPPLYEAPSTPKFVGSASCTAANCHGGADCARVSAGDPWSPVAYNIWISDDPHAQSYQTLLSDESAQMAAKLGIGPAHRAASCLACHAPEAVSAELAFEHRSTPMDGVGCESCHGPAERWLSAHKTAQWRGLPPESKADRGFANLPDLAVRSETCAACHVGSKGRDVNHDLIAAGHPRLLFEMSSLHARLPKHWQQEQEHTATLDAKLWRVGRLAGASSALQLLRQRCIDPASPWPEFAEYDCYACHHSLSDASQQLPAAGLARDARPGRLQWGTWNYAMLDVATPQRPTGDLSQTLQLLRSEMSQILPDRDRVEQLATDGRDLAAAHAKSNAVDLWRVDTLQQHLRQLSQPEMPFADSWDTRSQQFLGLAAMHYSSVALSGSRKSMPGSSAASRRDALAEMRNLLQFGTSEETTYNSPYHWDAARQQYMRDLLGGVSRSVDRQ